MNFYQKKLKEKEGYLHKKLEDTSVKLKKNKMLKMKNIKKNAQLGMF